jgi:hypothetical protein
LWIGGAVVVIVAAAVAVFLLTRTSKPSVASTGIGTPKATAKPTTTSTPAPTSTPTPANTTTAGGLGGFGDTDANPDSTFICAASASSNGTIIAYTTVAGSDSTTGKSLCSDLEQGGGWTDTTTIAAGAYDAVPGCWLSTEDGSVTARIYTAVPGGDDTTTQTLCTTLFDSAGITPSPSSG